MGTKIIPAFFFAMISCFLFGTVLSQAQPMRLDCTVIKGQTGAVLHCGRGHRPHPPPTVEGELVISADFLRELNITDDRTKTIYLLSEYPHPITSFLLDTRSGIRIKENALKALPNLTSLQFECFVRCNLTIPSEEFKNTPDLKSLSLRHSTISASTVQAIRATPKLEHLELWGADGVKLKSDTLRGLVKLNTLELTYSGFSTIEEGTFDGLTELTKLILDGNNISSITTSLPKDSRKLKYLSFHNNAISTIPKSAFAKYKELTKIRLSRNPITKLENGVFEGMENLVELDVYSCPIQQLPEGELQMMKHLEILSLSLTMISKINSTTFKGLRKLRELDFDKCKVLTTIEPGSFDDLVSVTGLYMRCNPNLKKLPDGLFKNMKMLRHVNIKDNSVENLSRANFTHCPDLVGLELGAGDCTLAG